MTIGSKFNVNGSISTSKSELDSSSLSNIEYFDLISGALIPFFL